MGPLALGPAIVAFFWGSSSTTRILLGALVFFSMSLVFGLGTWMSGRRHPARQEQAEARWSAASGVVAGTLPWIIYPGTVWGHYAAAFIFIATMSVDTLYSAMRPTRVWKCVMAVSFLSVCVFLAVQRQWTLAAGTAIFGGVLIGAHDAIQALVINLRMEKADSERIAATDPLTGLANRRRLNQYLSEAAAQDLEVLVAAIDIDDFKQINDRHGHTGGDVALVGLARHLERAFGDHWLCVRAGGDEFVCVSTDGTLHEARLALRAVPGQVFEDAVIPIRLSAGIAHGRPCDDDLLADASAALRISKQRGKRRTTVVDDHLRGKLADARRLGARLADAVERSEISVWAQPIVALIDTDAIEVRSYECLARWSTEDGTAIPPSIFIPMIEDQRLTRELGELVIEQAAAFAERLGPDGRVSVNVSASHFTDLSFIPFVHRTLQRHGLSAEQLIIEITETEDVPSANNAWAVARQLREMGIGLAIDDFGTGYASLERLLRFPCTQLKLDRSIVTNAADNGLEHLLGGFGAMSQQSGLEIVAEGVETAEQAAMLRSHGIPLAQGYLFGRPEPISSILAQLDATSKELPTRWLTAGSDACDDAHTATASSEAVG